MEDKKNSILARLLAVAALIVTIVVIVVAIGGAGGGDDDPGSKKTPSHKVQTRPKTHKKKYEVEAGDTLTTISKKTGIPVARLKQLNPDLDPQALQVGQELKLR
jgi:LysM repeat protein